MPDCHDCGTADGVQPYGLCLPCLTRRAVKSRHDAGLPTRLVRASDVFGAYVRRIYEEAAA